MTTTNKAFIDAYNLSPTQSGARPRQRGPLNHELLGTSEWVSATARVDEMHSGLPSGALPNVGQPSSYAHTSSTLEISTLDTTTLETPRIDRGAGAVRRPLSAVQADELFQFPQTERQGCEPCWPELCQNLLAQAADRYDAILRKLPNGGAGTLIGIVGAAAESACTTTAICLALRSSALGYTAALVDGNLTHGGLASVLQVDHFLSWAKLLNTSTSVATAVHSAEEVGVDLLLTDPLPTPVLESTSRFRASLAAGVLRRKYQRVVIDLGCPTQGDACLVGDLAAAMGIDFLIATATPSTTAGDLAATSAAMEQCGLELAGVVEAA